MKKWNKIVSKLQQNTFWKNLFKNSFWAFLGDSLASVINLIVTILLIRLIGNEGYGVFVLAQSYMQVVDVLLNVQCWKSVIQYAQKALVKKKYKELFGYIKLGCILDISTAILGGIVSIFAARIVGNLFHWSSDLILCAQLFSFTIFSHFSGTPTAVLRILNKFNLAALQKVISAFLKVISLVIVLILQDNISLVQAVIIYCIADTVGNILLVVFAGSVLQKRFKLKKILKSPVPADYKNFVKFTLWGTFSEIVDIPVNYFDVFIISFISTELVAVFKVFKQVISILSKLTSPIYQAILPQFSELTAKGEQKYGYRVVLKIRNAILFIMIPFSFIIGLSSPIWLNWIYGPLYAEYWYILLIYLLVQTCALSYTTIHPYFLSLGYVKESGYYILIANIVYMLIAFALVKPWGMIALVFAFAVQSFLAIFTKVHHIRREERIHE